MVELLLLLTRVLHRRKLLLVVPLHLLELCRAQWLQLIGHQLQLLAETLLVHHLGRVRIRFVVLGHLVVG